MSPPKQSGSSQLLAYSAEQNLLIKNALKTWEKGEKKKLAEKICHHVQDLATLSSEGLTSEDKEKFVNRFRHSFKNYQDCYLKNLGPLRVGPLTYYFVWSLGIK